MVAFDERKQKEIIAFTFADRLIAVFGLVLHVRKSMLQYSALQTVCLFPTLDFFIYLRSCKAIKKNVNCFVSLGKPLNLKFC